VNVAALVEEFIVGDIMMAERSTRLEPQQCLIGSGIIDSLGLLRLIAFIEERFGVVMDDEEVIPENFDSIEAIVASIERKQKQAG
jgi:acyl carrier protein